MPMPFKKEATTAALVEPIKRTPDEGHEPDGLEMAMEEFCQAIESKDYKLASEVFRSCFDLMEDDSHMEGSDNA